MPNASPPIRDPQRESTDALADEALFVVGEQRIVLGRLERAQKNIEALGEARRIERAELVADIEHVRADLRVHEERLTRLDEIDEQCDALGLEQMRIIVEAERELGDEDAIVSIAAKNAGIAFTRDDLIAKGAPVLLDRRRRRIRAAGATNAEAEVI
ncbi:MAG TPA: hypothetical protein VN906_13410 [Candidatus Sulfotelmatobacter sp.]|nr:hypothetical protein [Candidatus Sulfotelmatobacter sp.]